MNETPLHPTFGTSFFSYQGCLSSVMALLRNIVTR
jgi:hypothetical protein